MIASNPDISKMKNIFLIVNVLFSPGSAKQKRKPYVKLMRLESRLIFEYLAIRSP